MSPEGQTRKHERPSGGAAVRTGLHLELAGLGLNCLQTPGQGSLRSAAGEGGTVSSRKAGWEPQYRAFVPTSRQLIKSNWFGQGGGKLELKQMLKKGSVLIFLLHFDFHLFIVRLYATVSYIS